MTAFKLTNIVSYSRLLRVITPAGNTAPFKEKLQRWRADVNTMSDLIGSRFEPQTSCSKYERVTARPTGRSKQSCSCIFLRSYGGRSISTILALILRKVEVMLKFHTSSITLLLILRSTVFSSIFDLRKDTSDHSKQYCYVICINLLISGRVEKRLILKR